MVFSESLRRLSVKAKTPPLPFGTSKFLHFFESLSSTLVRSIPDKVNGIFTEPGQWCGLAGQSGFRGASHGDGDGNNSTGAADPESDAAR